MRTAPLISTILLTLLSFSFYGQKLNRRDKERLVNVWKETLHFIETKDTTGLRKVCYDVVEYTDKDTTGTSTYRYVPLHDFFKQTLDSLVPDKGLRNVVRKNQFRLQTINRLYFPDGSGHKGLSVEFYKGKRRKKKEAWKQRVVIFTYVDFKLFWIFRQF